VHKEVDKAAQPDNANFGLDDPPEAELSIALFSRSTCALAFLPKTLQKMRQPLTGLNKVNTETGVNGTLGHHSFHSSIYGDR